MSHLSRKRAAFHAVGFARSLARMLMTLIALSYATASIGSPPKSDPAGFVDRKLTEIGPYDEASRLQTYVAISELFDRLWLHPKGKKVLKKTDRSSLENMAFQLEDRDADGKADFYVYYPPGKYNRAQDFGAFFDLNRDGRPDWIVFYGGTMFTKDFKPLYWHQHGIDTNGDGQFDIWVIGAIDMDGDGFVEDGATAWIQDVDHDGHVDKAYHVVDGQVIPIEPEGKRLPLRCVMPFAQAQIGKPIISLFSTLAADITANLEGD